MSDPTARNDAPLVTVGMPVFNEARFIEQSLDALLAQDYPNFEILISDNASTDETAQICARYAERDPRVQLHRCEHNIGAAANFRLVAERSSGTYFMWAAGHDLWSPNWLGECVALLESHPDAVLAFGSSRWIGADGEVLARESGWTDTRGMPALARFFTVLWGNMHPILGVMRSAHLRAAKAPQDMVGADLVLLCDLALRGHFVHATEADWARREFRTPESHQQRIARYRSGDYALARSRLAKLFPMARLPLELIRLVVEAELPWPDKLLSLMALGSLLPLRYLVGKR